jgi:hypothetical protein
MPDLKLDPTTGDLYQAPSGDLALTDDTTGETTGQLVAINVKTLLGEWFLDTTKGLDYFGLVFVKNPDLAAIETAIKDLLLGVRGVAGVLSYSQSFDRAARKLTVSGALRDDYGATIPFQEVLGP